ncbi:hypothetical protein D3C71_1846380 [compost metagenome]
MFQRRPLSLTVPMYLPNRLSTAAWLGWTMYRPQLKKMPTVTSTMPPRTSEPPPLAPFLVITTARMMAAVPASIRTIMPSRAGMPGRERMDFSFMADLPWWLEWKISN